MAYLGKAPAPALLSYAEITGALGFTPLQSSDLSSYANLTTAQSLLNKTLSTGSVWNGNAIGVAYGGTGQTTFTDGQLLIGNSTGNTLTKATLTPGSGIGITNSGGSITITNTQTPGVSTGKSIAMAMIFGF